jgi:hypothetical protein
VEVVGKEGKGACSVARRLRRRLEEEREVLVGVFYCSPSLLLFVLVVPFRLFFGFRSQVA